MGHSYSVELNSSSWLSQLEALVTSSSWAPVLHQAITPSAVRLLLRVRDGGNQEKLHGRGDLGFKGQVGFAHVKMKWGKVSKTWSRNTEEHRYGLYIQDWSSWETERSYQLLVLPISFLLLVLHQNNHITTFIAINARVIWKCTIFLLFSHCEGHIFSSVLLQPSVTNGNIQVCLCCRAMEIQFASASFHLLQLGLASQFPIN